MFGIKTTKSGQGEGASAIANKVEDFLLEILAKQTVDEVLERAKPLIDEYVLQNFGVLPRVIRIEVGDKTSQMTGVFHEKFETVLKLASMEMPVFLSGEAGTGKNVICKQVAEAMDLEFYFTNAVTQEFQLKGFTDANGTYHETQFYQAFKYGGLFFLDEIDASVPETLIILNSAIANGYFDFPAPIGRVKAHKDFRVISAGNTMGTGADAQYTGRFQLDAASLDRFILVEVDYSPEIELKITDGNLVLCEFARAFRDITKYSSIKCLFTYRSLERINKMEKMFPLDEVLKMTLIKGLGVDDLQFICDKFGEQKIQNEYTKALHTLCEKEKESVYTLSMLE